MAIGLYWWRPHQSASTVGGELVRHGAAWVHASRGTKRFLNFGDEFSRDVTQYLLGAEVAWRTPRRAHVFGVGSILTHYPQGGHRPLVLGSGVRALSAAPAVAPPANRIHLVRGRLTAQAVGCGGSAPMGDPGLIVADILRAASLRRGQTGVDRRSVVIPHFSSYQTRQGRDLLTRVAAAGARVVPPTEDWRSVAGAVEGAACVFSASLHGMVFADSFNVPAQLVQIGDEREPIFKYDDYLSALGEKVNFRRVEDLFALISSAKPDAQMEDRAARVEQSVETVKDRIRSAGLEAALVLSKESML